MSVPSDYANLVLWLKGDAGVFTDAGVTPAINNGDLIQQWNDQSGVGNHATQATSGFRPTLNTTGLNGRNIVAFVGASGLFFNLPNLLSGASAGEIFLVVKLVADPPGSAGITGLYHLGSDGAADSHFPYTDGAVYDSFGTTARKDVGDPALSLASVHRVYNVYSAASDWAAYLNRGLLIAYGTNTVSWTATPTFGQSRTTYWLDGTVAEVVAYSRKLAAEERSGVWEYLGADRYALWRRSPIMPMHWAGVGM